MRKIIGGKMYDTDTAKKVGEWDNQRYGDFQYCAETLYQKRTGEFFLYGESGPAGRYAESAGNMMKSGKAIVPMTYNEAREWVENNLDADDYEALFGEVTEEDEGKTIVTFSLPVSTVIMLRQEAAKSGKSQSALVEMALVKAFGEYCQ